MNKFFNSRLFGNLSPAKKSCAFLSVFGVSLIPFSAIAIRNCNGANYLDKKDTLPNVLPHSDKTDEFMVKNPFTHPSVELASVELAIGGSFLGYSSLFIWHFLKNSKQICTENTRCKLFNSNFGYSAAFFSNSIIFITGLMLTSNGVKRMRQIYS